MTIPRSRSVTSSSCGNTLSSLPTPTPTSRHGRPESVTYRMTFSQFLKYISLAHTDYLKLMEEVDADEDRYYLREAIRLRQIVSKRGTLSPLRSSIDFRRFSTFSISPSSEADDLERKEKQLATNKTKSKRVSQSLNKTSPSRPSQKSVAPQVPTSKLTGLKPLPKSLKDRQSPQHRQALTIPQRLPVATLSAEKSDSKTDDELEEDEEEEQRTPSPPYSFPKIIRSHTYTGINACSCVLPLPIDCPDRDLLASADDFWNPRRQSRSQFVSGSPRRRMPPIAEERTAEEEEARRGWLRQMSKHSVAIQPLPKAKGPNRSRTYKPTHDPYERFRYHFTSSPTPVRVYITYREPPKVLTEKKPKEKDITPRKHQ